ncbi:CopG family ribbon-helix-helix protein [Bradyrhizobium sp.]|uniref:CopG family ribbon-helix-helix protein n=1 Tax=Bradyrhizobium sp. TaxID=376 RepID=UPI003C5C24D4
MTDVAPAFQSRNSRFDANPRYRRGKYPVEIVDALDCSSRDANFECMEIRLLPEQEARLAARDGRDVNQLAQEAIARLLDDDARFADAVKRGVAAADRGEFVASEDVWSNVERIL